MCLVLYCKGSRDILPCRNPQLLMDRMLMSRAYLPRRGSGIVLQVDGSRAGHVRGCH